MPAGNKVVSEYSLYSRVGGKEVIAKVHKVFYQKIFSHPWIGLYFQGKKPEILENQQTDFMVGFMGGPLCYSGRAPVFVHQHMMISEELFDLRNRLLSDSIRECGIDDELREEWLVTDRTMKKALVKAGPHECIVQASEPLLDFKNPLKK